MALHEENRAANAYGVELLREEQSAEPPTKATFLELSKRVYRATAGASVDGFVLKVSTPTVAGWVDASTNRVIIAIRGTVKTSPVDITADLSLLVNQLAKTIRYKGDKEVVQRILTRWPSDNVYITGHSLGGAIATQLKRDFPTIKGAFVFNSAFQLKDLANQGQNIVRWYTTTDPLYQAGGNQFAGVKMQNTANEFAHELSNFDQ